jgi:hypothetical protein
MTSRELIAHLSQDCDEPEGVVTDLLVSLADTIEAELLAHPTRSVELPGLGRFSVHVPPQPTRSILVSWTSDTGLRQRVTAALNAQAARTPAPTGPMTPARTQRLQRRGKATR